MRAFLLPGGEECQHLAFRPDGGAVAMASHRGVGVMSLPEGHVRSLGLQPSSLQAMVWTEAGLTLADAEGGTVLVDEAGRVRAEAAGVGVLAVGQGALLRLRTPEGAARYGGTPALEVLDASTLGLQRSLPLEGQVLAVQGAHALVASSRGVTLVDWERGRELHRAELPDLPSGSWVRRDAVSVALAPDGRRYVVSGHDHAWLGELGSAPRWLPEHGVCAFLPEGILVGASLLDEGGSPQAVLRLTGLPLLTRAVAVSADGRWVALQHQGALYVHALGTLGARQAARPGAVRPVTALALSPDGRCLAGTTTQGELLFWDTEAGKLRAAVDTRNHDAAALGFTADGRLLVGTSRGVEVWDPEGPRRLESWMTPELTHVRTLSVRGDRALAVGRERAVLFDAAGGALAVFGPWKEASQRNVTLVGGDLHPSGEAVLLLREREEALLLGAQGEAQGSLPPLRHGVFHAGGEALLTSDGRGSELRRFPLQDEPTETRADFELAASMRQGLLWAKRQDLGVFPLDAQAPTWVRRFHDPIGALAVGLGTQTIYTSGEARWIAERDLRDGRLRRALPAGSGGQVRALALDPSGELLAVGDGEGRIHLWRLGAVPERLSMLDGTSLQPEGTLFDPGEMGPVQALAFPGALVAVCGHHMLHWVSPGTMALDRNVCARRDVHARGLSADGRRAWNGGEFFGLGDEVEVLDVDTGQTLAKMPGPLGSDQRIALSPQGDRLLMTSSPGQGTEIALWSVQGPRRLATLHVDRPIRQARFLPDGSVGMWLDAPAPDDEDEGVSGPGLLCRWDVAACVVERWLPSTLGLTDAHGVEVGGGRALFWGWGPQQIVDLASGERIAALSPHELASVTAGALSADGRVAVTADGLGEIRVWDASTGAWRASFCSTLDGGTWVRTAEVVRDVPGPHWKDQAAETRAAHEQRALLHDDEHDDEQEAGREGERG
ncbi:WD40 repeat domain-containing protein [Chondromyces crocatus]|nr:WD40 repeat domain-containing protein [Chondromyces crocatus]